MEISINNTHEASGLSKVCDFTIETNGIMVKALTSRLYSNPIASIVRELASNALDACSTIPMEISLPSPLDPQFTIQDYGPGISPDDMASIFTHFGSSTKRNTNTQIGGFGLGAKSPFAIVNSFTIYSHYQGTCYHYIASIQKDGMPALHLVTTASTNISGVMIQVPASSNFFKWKEALSQIRFFHPQPKISNGAGFVYPETLYDCSDFSIYKGGFPAILVGPVAYPFQDEDYITGGAKVPPLALKFDIGELEVTASREEIVYTQEVILKIRNKFSAALNQYRIVLQSLLNKTATLDEAFTLLSSDAPYLSLTFKGSPIASYGWDVPTSLKLTGRLLGRRDQTRIKWNLSRPWGYVHAISSNTLIFVADVGDKLQHRITLHPKYKNNGNEILIVDCDPAQLDAHGITYHLLSSVPVPKGVGRTPVRLRTLDSSNRFRSTTEKYSHYLQLDVNKQAKINGVVSDYNHRIHLLFTQMLGFNFYVLPHNIKKIPAHLSPVEPEILAKVPEEMTRHRAVLLSHHYHQLSSHHCHIGKFLSVLGLISPVPLESVSAAPIAHLCAFRLDSSSSAASFFPNWSQEITHVLNQHPKYKVLKYIQVDVSRIPDIATLISKE